MKLFISILSFIAFSTFAFAQDTDSEAANKSMPSAELKTLEGETVNITDYTENGKITVVSFWATWCTPCKKELDALMDFYPDWKDEYDIDFVAITIDDARGLPKVRSMVHQKSWEYTILSDVQQVLPNALGFQPIPQTFVLDKEGKIVYNHSSYVPGYEYELDEMVRELAEKG